MKKGFTLIEVIVVVAVLAALSAIALPNFSGITKSGNNQACAANRQTVQSVYQAYATRELYTGGSVNEAKCAEIFKKAVSEVGGSNPSVSGTKGSYKGKCGGTITVDFNYSADTASNYLKIIKTNCDKHGGDTVFLGNPVDTIIGALEGSGIGSSSTLDSEAPDVFYPGSSGEAQSKKALFYEYLAKEGISLDSYDIKSFSVESGSGVMCWSSVEIADVAPGTWVKVMRYNPNYNGSKTFTAGYKKVVAKTNNGATYNVFPEGTNGNWEEYKGVAQNTTTKASFDTTYDIYKAMPDTK